MGIDPERDTPKSLTAFTNKFHDRIQALSPVSEADLKTFMKVFRAKTSSRNEGRDIFHPGDMFLISSEAKFYGKFLKVENVSEVSRSYVQIVRDQRRRLMAQKKS